MKKNNLFLLCLLFGNLSFLIFLNFSYSQVKFSDKSNIYIDSLTPKQNAVNVNTATNISVYFKQSMNANTLNNTHIKVFGAYTGLKNCNITYNQNNRQLLIDPVANFKNGELVCLVLDTGIKTGSGISITPFDYNFTTVSANGTGTYNLFSNITVGSSPLPIASADFNNDGYLDLAVANTTGVSSASMNILINNGSGGYTLASTLITDAWPWSIAAADFDNDGDIDLAVNGAKFATLTIFKNNGAGNFTNFSIVYLSFAPNIIEKGDINGDGYIDLVTSNFDNDNITILKNNGTGIFSQTLTLTAGDYPNWVNIGDLDNDGNLDIVIVNKYSSNVSIFRNYGGGAFSLMLTLTAGNYAWSGTLLDINNNGLLDIAVCNYYTNDVTIFKNMGNWNFINTGNVPIGTNPIHIISGDFNCDGFQDLATANKNSNNISILMNNGSGGFSQTALYQSGTLPSTIAITDVENDGDIDLAVVNIGSNNVSIFKNINLTPPQPTLISPPNNSTEIPLTPTFSWSSIPGVTNYKFQVSTLSNFAVIKDSATVTTNYYAIQGGKLQIATTYFWRVNATNSYGTGPWSVVWTFSTVTTGINLVSNEIPNEYKLYENYPNPFNPYTNINFDIPADKKNSGLVTLKVFNILGEEVTTIINQKLSPGKYQTKFYGSDFPSGVYFYILKTDNFVGKNRMILLK